MKKTKKIRKQIKNYLLFTSLLLVFTLVFAVSYTVNFSKSVINGNVNTTRELKRKSFNSDLYGDWDFSTSVSVTADDYYAVNADGTEVRISDATQMEALTGVSSINPVTLTITGTYKANSATTSIDTGVMRIKLPINLFTTDSYSYVTTNATKGYILARSADGTTFNRIETTIKKEGTAGSNQFYYNFTDSSATDGYIYIFNNQVIPLDSDFTFEINLKYRTLLSAMVIDSPNVITPEITFAGVEETTANSVTTVYPTASTNYLDNTSKLEEKVYDSWQDDWGTKPSGTDSYYFIEYGIEGTVTESEAYDLNVTATVDTDTDTLGTIVAYGDGTTYKIGSYDEFLNDNTIVNPTGAGLTSKYGSINSTSPNNDSFKRIIVVKYPKPNEGVTVKPDFKMGVQVTGTSKTDSKAFNWTSSYTGKAAATYPNSDNFKVKASSISSTSGAGAINNLKNGNEVTLSYRVEADSDLVNQGIKNFNIWKLTNNGTVGVNIKLALESFKLDSTYETDTDPYTLTSTDYYISSFYPENDSEYSYVLRDSGYVLTTDNTSMSRKKVYIKTGNSSSYDYVGYYAKGSDGHIAYTSMDTSKTQNNTNVTSSNPVLLPNDTVDMYVETDSVKAGVYIGYNVNVVLKNSSNIISKIASMDGNKILKISSKSYENGTAKESSTAGVYLYEYEAKTNMNIVTDKLDENNINYTINAFEQVNKTSTMDTIAKNYIVNQETGKFYVLLPAGASVTNVKVVPYNTTTEASIKVTKTDNYNNSGRTLMLVDVLGTNLSSLNYVDGSTFYQSGFALSYSLNYPNSANASHGTSLYTDAAYLSGSALSQGYKVSTDAPTTLFSSTASRNTLSNLSNSEPLFTYATNTTEVEAADVIVGNYVSTVSNSTVKESKEYSYTMNLSYGNSGVTLTNMVFFDKIDSAKSTNNFKGILKNVNVDSLTSIIGSKPTIYYSTLETIDVSDSAYQDLTNEIWSVNAPTDLSTVTAIAIDCGSYEFNTALTGNSPSFTINLVAPNSYSNDTTLKAYNDSVVTYLVKGNSTGTMKSLGTEVTLEKANIVVSGEARDSIKGSTINSSVSGGYGYLLTLTNSDEVDYENITLSSVLSDNLDVSETDIKYFIDNGSVVNGNALTITKNGNSLSLKVNKVTAGSTFNIWIPVSINATELRDAEFTNTYRVTKLNDVNYNDPSKKITLTASIPSLEFNKRVKVGDEATFNGSANPITVSVNDDVTYKIEVTNTSTIIANNVVVTDNVIKNLIPTNISNDGTYSNGVVTWNVSINPGETKELTYDVKLPSSLALNEEMKSNGHVKLVNPLNTSSNLYDDDTNEITLKYQIVTDLTISNVISGPLADSEKVFNYTITLSNNSNETYNTEGTDLTSITFENGVGRFSLVGNQSITILSLPDSITYKVSLNNESGYSVTTDKESTTNEGVTSLSGVTNALKISNTFTNTYSASTNLDLSAQVTYDDELTSDMFTLELLDSEGNVLATKTNSLDGTVTFDSITYTDEVGTYNYVIRMNSNPISHVSLDTNTFNVKVVISDNKDGSLGKQVTITNKLDEEVDRMVFNNIYIPDGLMITNTNDSKYVDSNKEFKYTVTISDSVPGEYKLLNGNKEEIGTLTVLEDGTAEKEFVLKSDEKILIVNLPVGSKYTILKQKVNYYTETSDGATETEDGLVVTGTLEESSKEVKFNNNYVTSGNAVITSTVGLDGTTLSGDDFRFNLSLITSAGNELVSTISNDINGNIVFPKLNFDKPGVYKYQISEVDLGDRHFTYDSNLIFLTVTLTDNGDNTMDAKVEVTSDVKSFMNSFSATIPEEHGKEISDNPNTIDKSTLFVILFVISFVIVLVSRIVKVRKFN